MTEEDIRKKNGGKFVKLMNRMAEIRKRREVDQASTSTPATTVQADTASVEGTVYNGPKCAVCNKPAPSKCGICNCVRYCSAACQKTDVSEGHLNPSWILMSVTQWRIHKHICKEYAIFKLNNPRPVDTTTEIHRLALVLPTSCSQPTFKWLSINSDENGAFMYFDVSDLGPEPFIPGEFFVEQSFKPEFKLENHRIQITGRNANDGDVNKSLATVLGAASQWRGRYYALGEKVGEKDGMVDSMETLDFEPADMRHVVCFFKNDGLPKVLWFKDV